MAKWRLWPPTPPPPHQPIEAFGREASPLPDWPKGGGGGFSRAKGADPPAPVRTGTPLGTPLAPPPTGWPKGTGHLRPTPGKGHAPTGQKKGTGQWMATGGAGIFFRTYPHYPFGVGGRAFRPASLKHFSHTNRPVKPITEKAAIRGFLFIFGV